MNITINILEYLAYGPYDPRSRRVRPYFPPGTKFSLHLFFTRDDIVTDVTDALFALTHFGGMGSRSRNGFGSLHLCNPSELRAHLSPELDLDKPYAGDTIMQLANRAAAITPYSSFCTGTKLFMTPSPKPTWDDALAEVGRLYRGIRVGDNTLNGRVFEQKHRYDKRQYLGAPLDPYQENFHSLLDRHAKPYFMKVAKEDGGYRAYILYLPSLYADRLDEGRNHRAVHQGETNRKFRETCKEFNDFLARYTDTVV